MLWHPGGNREQTHEVNKTLRGWEEISLCHTAPSRSPLVTVQPRDLAMTGVQHTLRNRAWSGNGERSCP